VTGVELVVAALAAGATAGVTNTATIAVQDAYSGLKRLLGRWLTDRQQAVEALQAEETEPGVWQTRIGDDLAASGAADDAEVLAAARQLLGLVDPDAVRRIDVTVHTNYGAAGTFSGPVTFNYGQPPTPPGAA
jgi:hypothetical protein